MSAPVPQDDVYAIEEEERAPARPLPVRVAPPGPAPILAGADLDRALELYRTWRDKLKQFIREQLVEATYDERGGPVGGDYYRIYKDGKPTGSFALRIAGADKVRQFMGWFPANRRTVRATETAEFVSYTQAVELVTHDGELRGSGEGTCTSAEKGFQNQNGRYRPDHGPLDWRAAASDISTRATIRAIRNAVQEAAGLREIFNEILAERAPAAAAGAAAGPLVIPHGKYRDCRITAPVVPVDYLAQLEAWYRERGKEPEAEQIVQELERRREATST